MRIVVLTIDIPEANRMTEYVVRHGAGCVVGIVSSTVIVPGKSNGEAVRFLLRRAGPRFVLHRQLEQVISRLAGWLRRLTLRPPHVRTVRQIGSRYRVPIVRTHDVNAGPLRAIHEWRPDLLVSIYLNQIIRRPLLDIAPRGAINVHPALLPKNRGLLPTFWTLANGDHKAGVTVHWIDSKLDTGDLLAQADIAIAPRETSFSLAHRCARLGGPLLCDVIAGLWAGDLEPTRQNEKDASYYSWPDRLGLRRFHNRGRRLGSAREMWRAFYGGQLLGDAPT